MGTINRVPFGWLSLIDSQNFGRNPVEALESVTPTVDLYTLLGQDRLDVVLNSAAPVGGTNALVSILVPQNEVWDLYCVSTRILLGPSGTATARFAIEHTSRRNTTGQTSVTLAHGPEVQPVYDAVSNARGVGLSWVAPRQYLALPGDTIAARVIDQVGAPFTAIELRVKRLRLTV